VEKMPSLRDLVLRLKAECKGVTDCGRQRIAGLPGRRLVQVVRKSGPRSQQRTQAFAIGGLTQGLGWWNLQLGVGLHIDRLVGFAVAQGQLARHEGLSSAGLQQ
jgi:hypothetical protein